MKNKLIDITDYYITGIKNPLLVIKGKINEEKAKIKLYADDKEMDYLFTNIDHNNSFILKAKFNKNNKKIKLYTSFNRKKNYVLTIHNNIIERLFTRLINVLKKIFIKINALFKVFFKGIKFLWKEHHFLVPPVFWKKYIKAFIKRVKNNGIDNFYNPYKQEEYLKWIEENEKEEKYNKFLYNPLISILIPVYNVDKKFLEECINSILNQSYKNYEICLVDDCSTNRETIETLKKYERLDKIKIKYRKVNGHISVATNDALKMAKGEFVGLVDNDDVLAKDALYEVVKVLNKNKDLDLIYSDEDKLDLNGKRCEPHFKPDYSPDTLLSMNYICHFTVLRKKIVDKIGGFTKGLEGAQDYDLFLRFTEQTNANKIYHISKILYHWRMVEGSTSMSVSNKSYATDKGKLSLEAAIKRRNLNAYVETEKVANYYRIVYEYKKEPKISIIIPTRDYADVLSVCLNSIYDKTDYKNFEVIIVNNGSVKKETYELFNKFKKYDNFNVFDLNIEFNYSKLNNEAVKKAKGDFIVLLNNDTEVLSKEWLKIMVGYAMQPHIGAVGVKLLYPDMTIQHGGVLLGLGGVAGHTFMGIPKNSPGIYGRLLAPFNYGAVTAACLMVEKKKYLEVKGLEEELKVNFNDIDFNIKLLKKGYYNIFLPQVELIHHESKSRGYDRTTEKHKRFVNETNYMIEKWNKELKYDKFYNSNFSLISAFMLDKKGSKK